MARTQAKKLSIIIHTKNEAKNIVACIKSCGKIAAEIIVADMASGDNTIMLAKKHGAKVIKVKDYGYLEPARKIAISRASGDWLLLLDADERLTAKLRKLIPALMAEDVHEAIAFPFKNILLGKWMKHSMRWPDYHVRLFKKGKVVWPKEIHSGHQVKGDIYYLPATKDNAIVHFNIDTISHFLQKIDKYTDHERFYEGLDKVHLSDMVQRVEHEYQWRHIEHQGYLDGMQGLVVNKLMEYYRFLEFAKYWERSGRPELFSQKELHQLWNKEHQPKTNSINKLLSQIKSFLNQT